MVVSYCLGFAILLSLATPSSFSQVLSETILTFDFVFLQKTTIKTRLRPRQIQSHLRCALLLADSISQNKLLTFNVFFILWHQIKFGFKFAQDVVQQHLFLHIFVLLLPSLNGVTFLEYSKLTELEFSDVTYFGIFKAYVKNTPKAVKKMTFLTLQATYCYFNQLCTCKVQAGESV